MYNNGREQRKAIPQRLWRNFCLFHCAIMLNMQSSDLPFVNKQVNVNVHVYE